MVYSLKRQSKDKYNLSKLDKTFISIAGFLFILALIISITGGFSFEFLGYRVSIKRANHPLGYMFYAIFAGMILSKNRLGFAEYAKKLAAIPVWKIVLTLLLMGAILQIAHFLSPYKDSLFDLDAETDIGTYYHSFLLFYIGAFVLIIYDIEKARKQPSFGWIPIIVVFWSLCIDELTGIHNCAPEFFAKLGITISFQSSSIPRWPIALAPFAIVVVLYFTIFFMNKFKGHRNLRLNFAFAILIWFLAFWMEMLIASSMSHKLQVGLEEGLELLGTSLFFLMFFSYYRLDTSTNEVDTD